MKSLSIAAIVLSLTLGSARLVLAQATHPTTSPAAQAVLDQVRDAYGKLKTLELAGTFTLDADVAAQQTHHNAAFTAFFESPNKFRHEMKDDVTVVGTGEKVFSFLQARNQYMTAEEPKDRTSEQPAGAGDVLREQNPSLTLALAANAADEITADTTSIEKIEDVQLEGKAFPALKLTQ